MAEKQYGQTFAKTLKAWFKSNDWPQSITEVVARSKGSKTGPWASQISHAMAGKHEPKVPFFLALAWFNQVVTERDYGGITDRRALDRLRHAEPLCHEDGQPYDAADFFKLYADLQEPPADLIPSEEGGTLVTEETVNRWVEGLRGGFKEACLALLQPPTTTWALIEQRGIERYKANKEDMDFVRTVLAGVHQPTIAEGIRLHAKYGKTNPFANSMVDIIEEAGGSSAEARALLSFMQSLPPTTDKAVFNEDGLSMLKELTQFNRG